MPVQFVEVIEWKREVAGENRDCNNSPVNVIPEQTNEVLPLIKSESLSSFKGLGTSPSSAFVKPQSSPSSVFQLPDIIVTHTSSCRDDDERSQSPLPSPPAIVSSSQSLSSRSSSPQQKQVQLNHSILRNPSPTKFSNRNSLNLRLLPLIEMSDWEKLTECVNILQLDATPRDIEIALGMQDIRGETPLHAAAYKAAPEIFLLILELVPMENRDEYLSQTDEEGNTPLHLACAHVKCADFCVIKNLILLSPQVLETVNVHGDTPLHLLVKSPAFQTSQDFSLEAAAAEAISSLVQMAGHLVTYPNHSGATLLHIAVSVGAHELVILKIIELSPISVQLTDHCGNLPIHYAASFGRTSSTAAVQLVETYPDSILHQNQNGDTPLHLLMVKGINIIEDGHVNRNTAKLLELLLGLDNTSGRIENIATPLLVRNNDSLSPLHVSVLYDTPPPLTRFLIKHVRAHSKTLWNEACVLTTAFGATPLHLVCAASSKRARDRDALAIIEALATDEACGMADDSGRTPLIVAVQNRKISKTIVHTIVKAYPKGARLETESGHLPLHLAVQSSKARKKIVRILIKAFPESVYALTRSRNTALHEACANKAPYNVLKYLLDKNEQALDERNVDAMTPIDLAKENHVPEKVLEYLHSRQLKRKKIKEEASIKLRLGRC